MITQKSATLACFALVAAVLPASFASGSDAPWSGEAGIVETVESLMARDAQAALRLSAPRAHRIHPRRRPDRSNLADAYATMPTTPVPKSLLAATSPAQRLGTEFTGATVVDTGSFPPDSMGAVGPSQFIVAVNGRVRTFDKNTGLKDGAIDVDTDIFFRSVMTPLGGMVVENYTTDPHIRYDRLSKRWFIVMMDTPGSNTSALANRIMIAVSNGSVITSKSSFTFFQFRHDLPTSAGDSRTNADYPTPGIDANAVYIGDSVFSNSSGSFVGSAGFVVRKSSLTSGGPIVVKAFRNLTKDATDGIYTPQGVDNYDPAAKTGYFIGTGNLSFGKLVLRRVTDPGGTPKISGNIHISVPETNAPMTVPHLGNNNGNRGKLDPVDDRLFAAHLRNGRLWTAHNIRVDSTGKASDTGACNGSRWYELSNLDTTPTLVQSGTVFDSSATNPKSYWIPSIMVSGQGHAAMGFSTAGLANHVNAGTCGRLAGDALGTMRKPLEYTASSTAYNPAGDNGSSSGRRWGDYSYTSLDPQDDMTMWTIQQYCNTTNRYGLRVVKLIAPPPATPVSCSPSFIPAGKTSITVLVAGTQISGSGFFDPGSGFAKHIRATVSNSVKVNSITYNSPSLVTLNLDTTAAATGPQNLTITNPDGQKRTGNGILTVGAAARVALSPSAPTNASTVCLKETFLASLAESNSIPSVTRDPSVITTERIAGAKYLSLAVAKSPGTRSQRQIVEVSPNLLDWYSGGNFTTVLQNDASLLRVRDNTPLAPGVKRFIRLKPQRN